MKTKNLLIAVVVICLSSVQSLLAQIPVLEWAKQIGGTGSDVSKSIAVDIYGNIYTTGRFYGTVDFDPGNGMVNLTSNGSFDIFIQKLDVHGNFLWAKHMGGTDIDRGISLAVDTLGNVYIVGGFEKTVDFDPGPGIMNLTSSGSLDIFIQKLDTDGNFLWARKMGGAYFDQGFSIAVDNSNNVYTTGCFYESADFDPGPETANLISIGYYDVYVQKLDVNGDLLWVRQMGGSDDEYGNSIAVDNSRNVYITGYFFKTTDFDPGTGVANLTSDGSADIFVQKLDANGDFLWAKRMGATNFDEGLSIAIDGSGNVYTTGYFEGSADFDPGLEVTSLNSSGYSDIFIQKLNNNGDFLWAKQMGGTSYDFGYSIAVDNSENTYITGSFQEMADLDPGEGTAYFTSAGSSNIFIQKLDISGNYLWARQMKGNSGDNGNSIKVDVLGNIYITGWFQGTTDFDPYEAKSNLTSTGSEDVFIQKFYPCFPSPPVPDSENLLDISEMCEINQIDAPAPKATSNCVGTITAVPNITFPITDQSVKQIVWTYDDESGNIVTQNQTINWIPIDVTTSLSGNTITANNSNGTYQWLDCNNNYALLQGEVGQSFTPVVNGNYVVEIAENGCIDTSSCISIILSLSEYDNEEKFLVFPNPSSDNFKIKFGKVFEHVKMEVVDIQGKFVYSGQVENSSEAIIELKEAAGLYLLRIKSKDYQKTFLLIKK